MGITYNRTHPDHHCRPAGEMLPAAVALRKAEVGHSGKMCPSVNSYKGNQSSKVGLQQFSQSSLGQRGKGGTIKERHTMEYFLPSMTPKGPAKNPSLRVPHTHPVPELPRAFT